MPLATTGASFSRASSKSSGDTISVTFRAVTLLEGSFIQIQDLFMCVLAGFSGLLATHHNTAQLEATS